ncbi:hypothetical protein L1887_40754 [Cichorium endivia]|nr:hypothetical protein L1887_40754 [Cichorium endivia]
MSMETHAPKKVLNLPNEPPVTLACPNDDIGCSLNVVTEQDNSVNSPQNETDARISSIYAAPDTSVSRIQRSKSRQKARELRTSGKSRLGDENRTGISFTVSKSDTLQVTQDKCPSEPAKCNDISGANSQGNGRTCDDKHSFLNDHSKTSDKEELHGGVNLHDTSLGSYGAKKSESSKTHVTQRQSKHYSGRITRSRGSRQETSGINELDTTASRNPKEGNNASNKLLDAVCNNGIGETQAISSNKSVKKPVISSNIAGSRVTRSRSNKECPLENAEIVVGNGPVEAQVVMQPVNSGMKLVPVTMCTESDGLCMLVKPKQLNFDEMDGCDSSKVSSLVSKKRKLDGLLGQELAMENVVSSQSKSARTYSDECTNVETMNIGLEMNENTVVEDLDDGLLGQECDSNTSVDHKSSGTFFEQQLPEVNVHDGFDDECAKDETMNISLEMNENPVVEGVEENSRVSLHDDGPVFHEGDKGEENPGGVSILNSSLTKEEGRRTSHQDLGSSKSNEFEVGTNSKLSNLKLNSAKFNTWPWTQTGMLRTKELASLIPETLGYILKEMLFIVILKHLKKTFRALTR